MTKNISFAPAFALLVTCCGCGCGEPYDPNLGQNPPPAAVSAAKERKATLIAIYKRAGGKWENMSPTDKKKLLELSSNNEAMAKQGWPFLGKMDQ